MFILLFTFSLFCFAIYFYFFRKHKKETFDKQTVVITGAGHGNIAGAFALHVAETASRIILIHYRAGDILPLKEACIMKSKGLCKVEDMEVDLASKDGFENALKNLPPCNSLILMHTISKFAKCNEHTDEDFLQSFAVNVLSFSRLAKVILSYSLQISHFP